VPIPWARQSRARRARPAINGPLRNSGGDVEIDGQLDLGAARDGPRLDATVRPVAANDRARADRIHNAGALGAPDGRGGYRVIWKGHLAMSRHRHRRRDPGAHTAPRRRACRPRPPRFAAIDGLRGFADLLMLVVSLCRST